jgi:hypothetical protein
MLLSSAGVPVTDRPRPALFVRTLISHGLASLGVVDLRGKTRQNFPAGLIGTGRALHFGTGQPLEE